MCRREGAKKTVRNYFKRSAIATVIFAMVITTACKKQELPSFADSLGNKQVPVQVIETQPLDNAQGIELDTPIQVSFNTAIDSATINETTFIIHEDTTVITGSFSFSDSIVTFKPSQEFDRSKVITTTLSSEIADTQGNRMSQEYIWNFTTRPLTVEERTPPAVTATEPQNGAMDIVLSTNIYAQFSKKLNAETINSNTFYVQNDNGSIISGSVSYADSTATAKFNPSGSLQDGTEYTATITIDIEDLFGYSPDQNYSWTFTTKEIDRSPPRIISTNPRNNELNVDDDIQITVTFNEPMDPATISNKTFLLYENRRSGFRQVSGSVDYANNTVRFTPNKDLRDREYYIAVISASVTDLAGNSLGERYRWTFLTEDN
ncbi:MAG: Ig-like domain-containing protein [Fodinibius sp.]|nr:Ig-like domain-containing protein [Fodinibius sp.]